MLKLFSVINLSPESPQKDSWVETPQEAIQKMLVLQQLKADYIDIGARSSFSKSMEIDDRIEQQRLNAFFAMLLPKQRALISLDTWSVTNAIKYLPNISVLNYTSTYFPEALINELANNDCPIILNYLPAANPYALRKIPYSPPAIKAIIDYFRVTVAYLEKKGSTFWPLIPIWVCGIPKRLMN